MEHEESDCNATLRELDTFLDDEMPGDARDLIRHHLDGCSDCSGAFRFHTQLKLVIREKCNSDEMPPDLLARIESCFDIDGDVGPPT